MKPSTRLSDWLTTRAGRGGGGAGARQVPTLYLAAAAAGGLLLVAAAVSAASPATSAPPAAAAAASKSGAQTPAANDRQSSSAAAPTPALKGDHLALPSSTTSARLVPLRHLEEVASFGAHAGARHADLSIGQSNIANAKVHAGPADMAAAAGHHYGKAHGKFYMYAESPKKGAFKAGFRRGNHKHTIERKEAQHKSHNHGYFKWHDKKGKGSHKWEFKHYDKKGKHHHHY